MMKLCTGSVKDTMRQWQLLIDDTGSVEGIYAFTYCTKWKSGQVSRMPYGQTLKDSATQLLIKYKSGALVTRCKKIGLGIQPGICVSLCIFSSLAPVGQTGLMQRSSSGLPTCLKWPTGSPHSNWVQGEV